MGINFGFKVFTLLFLTLLNEPVMSSWDFAVTTKNKISFYDTDWKEITSAAHQFDELSAITFDETEEVVFFNDQSHTNGTIFALKLSLDNNHRVERVLQKTKNELIQGIAFDPLDRVLYWTDWSSRTIYQWAIDTQNEPKVFMKLKDTKRPHGIAIDVCRRKLYWTNSNHTNPSIERASLDGSKYEVIIKDNLFMPLGITVDQFAKRIYWVDDLNGIHYAVGSAELDGTRRNVIRSTYGEPFNLAADKENVYFTDKTENAIYSVPKNASEYEKPMKLKILSTVPKGIVSNTHFLSAQADNPECKPIVEKLRQNLLLTVKSETPTTGQSAESTSIAVPHVFCLNDGIVNPKTNTCICTRQFKGDHCELPLCHNYCMGGTCHVSSTGFPECTCNPGYKGDRCERDVCDGYCLNNGRCNLERGDAVCHCAPSFSGRHCQTMNVNEVCARYCNEEQIDGIEVDLGKMCGNCSTRNATQPNAAISSNSGDSTFDNLLNGGSCKNSINETAVLVCIGVVLALVLVYIIVCSVRRIYKPLRPRIKKTYVVHKNVTPTPLTCRPTTEQCEITIENCCNMNICDTPCFDPKILQQEVSRKEDKKTLLNNMDADLMY